jgi:hypothetical protein
MLLLLSGLVSQAQGYYFFCINLGSHSDGGYIAEVIDAALKNNHPDEFVIYIRGGVNKDGKVFDAVKITDLAGWKEAKELLDYIDRCTVLAESEVDMMRKTIQSQYKMGAQGLVPLKQITVYWFGDEQYYRSYGSSVFLPFYFAADGGRTWRNCYLYGDSRKMKPSTVQARLGVSMYSLTNVQIK